MTNIKDESKSQNDSASVFDESTEAKSLSVPSIKITYLTSE